LWINVFSFQHSSSTGSVAFLVRLLLLHHSSTGTVADDILYVRRVATSSSCHRRSGHKGEKASPLHYCTGTGTVYLAAPATTDDALLLLLAPVVWWRGGWLESNKKK
jgi:hypothetical protein